MRLSNAPWVCPRCYDILAPAVASQPTALTILRKHEASKHPEFAGQTIIIPSGVPAGQPKPPAEAPAAIGPPVTTVIGPRVTVLVKQLHFTPLPPGTWKMSDVVSYYRAFDKNRPANLGSRTIDWRRITELEKLRPDGCFVGRKGWYGYVVFEFSGVDRVILECPLTNNATYILIGEDWQSLVTYSKSHLLKHHGARTRRVLHTADWFSKVEQAIRFGRRVAAAGQR